MAETVETRETFPKSVGRPAVEEERKLRIKAGAIRSRIEETDEQFLLITEWNIIGDG